MQRFFVPPETLAAREVQISGEAARQISRVLRMQPGDRVCLLDGLGWEYAVRLTGFGKDEVAGEVVEKTLGEGEPACKITLYLSLLNKADKFEWALQKCTEIGVAAFVPVRSARSVADTPSPTKIERWARIIQEAAEQSGRSILPALGETLTMTHALKQIGCAAIMPALGADCSLGGAMRGVKREGGNLAIIVGPEGGFTDDETKAAQEAGVTRVTLGPRTLRAETAAVAALTMALHELGEMGERKT
jgi:16S rRNA (uracil1498-N3)-methyltransferase